MDCVAEARSLRQPAVMCSDDLKTLSRYATILPRLKLERIQLSFAHSDIVAEWEKVDFHTVFIACISTSYMKELLD